MAICYRISQLLLAIALSGTIVAPVQAGGKIQPAFEPGYRPASDSDEGGFWLQVDKFEQDVMRAPQRVRDPALNQYVQDLVCRLAGEYCSDIRVYIVKNPHFNASMYPNGMMHIFTGLLLRVENEAQLAAVLGHEIGHYLRAHQIERWRSLRNGASAAIFFDMVLTAGLATLAVASGSSAFGRDQEMEADRFGLELMASNGYEPTEAVNLWDYIRQEEAADNSKASRNIFFATHPQPKERIDALNRPAVEIGNDGKSDFATNQQAYFSVMKPLYFDYMDDHFNLQEYQQTEMMLEKHLEMGYPQAQVTYFKGRLATLQKSEDYPADAEEAFLVSIRSEGTPARSYRDLAYLYLKSDRKDEAGGLFQQYLERDPDATDRKMIEFYLSSIGNSND